MLDSDTKTDAVPRSLRASLFDRVDSLILVYIRVVTGIAIYFWAFDFLVDDQWNVLFVQPRFQFKYAGFEWVRLWPGNGIYWHFFATAAVSVFLVIGLLTRISAALLCGAIAYVLLVERQIYVNHYYLLACVAALLVFLPSSRRLSVDSWVGVERREATFARWQFWLLRFQLGIPYVFGALAKLNGDWLRGQPAELILRTRTNLPGVGPLTELPGAVETMVYGGFLYDLLIVPMLLYRRTRWIAVAVSIGFHLSNALILTIGVFPWFMLATIILFFPVQTLPNRWRLFLGQRATPAGSSQSGPTLRSDHPGLTGSAKTGLVLAGIYVAVQIILPIRPWLFPGDANWNERGHRFAWRMMLRDKRALTHFLLVDTTNSEYIFVPATIVLTQNQSSGASDHPELIRQTAVQLNQLVAREFGVVQCRVYALALVSLNGRRPTPLVDPAIDLSRVQRGWWQDDWVIDDPGPFLDPPWTHDMNQWWKQLVLPDRFKPLQGRTPSDLQRFLEERKRIIEQADRPG